MAKKKSEDNVVVGVEAVGADALALVLDVLGQGALGLLPLIR